MVYRARNLITRAASTSVSAPAIDAEAPDYDAKIRLVRISMTHMAAAAYTCNATP